VQFLIDGVPAAGGVRPLNASGVATLASSTLSGTPNPHAVTAVYSADAVFGASTSNSLSQIVNKANSTTTVTSSLNPSRVANTVTFTARVTPTAATGSVRFSIGGVLTAPVVLDATGRATLTRTFTANTYAVFATYSGSTNYNVSSSVSFNQVVTP
jgi:hypothetical protein